MVHFEIDAVLLSVGPITIRWYGLMYLIGFILAFAYCYQHRYQSRRPWTVDELLDLFFYGALGVIFGGTWGYLLIYQPQEFLHDPLQALKFWAPGRSFHGGLLGVILSLYVFCKQSKRSFWEVCDFIAPAVPLGIALGRLGNFINAELWGRVTSMPWGMHFIEAGPLPRHPSALYEGLLEGLVLFMVLHAYARKPRQRGAVSAMFLIAYGLLRSLAECFREPDLSQGFIMHYFTMGQILCVPMILLGLWLLKTAARPIIERRH